MLIRAHALFDAERVHGITKAHLDDGERKISRLSALRDELRAMVACSHGQGRINST